jgi:hypothetical protein
MRWIITLITAVVVVALVAPPASAVWVEQKMVDRMGDPLFTDSPTIIIFTNIFTNQKTRTYVQPDGKLRVNLSDGVYRAMLHQGQYVGTWIFCVVSNGQYVCGNAFERGQNTWQHFPDGVLAGSTAPKVTYRATREPLGTTWSSRYGNTSWGSGLGRMDNAGGRTWGFGADRAARNGGPVSVPINGPADFLSTGSIGIGQFQANF